MKPYQTKATAEPQHDCWVGRDVVAMLRERAARKWTDEANRSASLFGQAADEIERLRKIEAAAKNLVAQKGRYHTEQAYAKLAALLTPNGGSEGREPACGRSVPLD